MADGKIEKKIEFEATKAVVELDKVINRLTKTANTLDKMQAKMQSLNFDRFIPSIEKFATSFESLKIDPKTLSDIQIMAQALNRYRMTAVELAKSNSKVDFSKITQGVYSFTNSIKRMEISGNITSQIESLGKSLNRFRMVSEELNKSDFNVSFSKMSRAVYSFTDSISRMNMLSATVTQISSLGLAMNRLVSISAKLQNVKVSFTSLTQAIYAFVGSILRIKDLETVISRLERLGNAINNLNNLSQRFSFVKFFTQFNKMNDKIKKLEGQLGTLKVKTEEALTPWQRFEKMASSAFAKLSSGVGNINTELTRMRKLLSLSWLRSIISASKRLGETIYDLVKAYSEYIENINLSTVAYNGLEEAASKLYPFVEKISNAFGLNESEVIRSIGLFKQMANAMGLAQEQGDLLATSLTKMAYDISSLYNISFERAMSALQSSLVGKDLPLALVIVLANLFNCVKVLIKWFISKIIRRKVLQLCHTF